MANGSVKGHQLTVFNFQEPGSPAVVNGWGLRQGLRTAHAQENQGPCEPTRSRSLPDNFTRLCANKAFDSGIAAILGQSGLARRGINLRKDGWEHSVVKVITTNPCSL